MYCNIQELLLKAARNEQYQAELDLVTDFYGSNLNPYLLNTQYYQQCLHHRLTRVLI